MSKIIGVLSNGCTDWHEGKVRCPVCWRPLKLMPARRAAIAKATGQEGGAT